MSDAKRDVPLPPVTRPAGTYTPGTILEVPVKRMTRKSPFLRKLERAQAPRKTTQARCKVTPLQGRTRGS